MSEIPSLVPANWHDFQHYKDRDPSWIKLHVRILNNFDFCSLPVASRALAPCLWLLASQYKDAKIPYEPEKLAWRIHWQVADLNDAIKPLIKAGFFTIDAGEDANNTSKNDIEMKCNNQKLHDNGGETTQIDNQLKNNNSDFSVQDASSMLANCSDDCSELLDRGEERREETEKSLNIKSAKTASNDRNANSRSGRRGADDDPSFREFWDAYPRKVGKGQAKRAWLSAARKAKPAEILAALHAYRFDARPEYRPHPATWLNGERWLDDNSTPAASTDDPQTGWF